MKASDLFVSCLEAEGVRQVFGVPGEENLDLVESLRQSSIELVVTRHEQHAAFMAATCGRLTGRAGVCLATLGPGALNLITGLAHAQLGGMPLLAITGQKGLRHNRQGAFQLVDVVATFRPLTKWNASIADPETIPRCVRHAIKTAEGERPGAVHLELPEDVAGEEVPEVDVQPAAELRRPVPDAKALELAARLVEEAERPILICSGGANRKRIGRQLRAFVERTGIYVIATQMGKGVLPEDHPQSLFSLGIHKRDFVHEALDRADLVITLGYNIVEYPPVLWSQGKRILHVDFNPAEPDQYYAPTLEVVGDISHALTGLGERIRSRFDDPALAAEREELDRRLHAATCPDCHPPGPRRVVYDVREVMGREDIVCLDNGIYKVWFARLYRTYAENTLLLDNALATMGAGLASAMAAKRIHPERRVLAVCGDGGFMMNSQDLETAVRLDQDLVVLILRDDGYGFIRWKQQEMGFPEYGMDFGNPDFVAYAEAYGARGLRVEPGRRVREVLEEAFALGGVVVVDCPVDYSENRELSSPTLGGK